MGLTVTILDGVRLPLPRPATAGVARRTFPSAYVTVDHQRYHSREIVRGRTVYADAAEVISWTGGGPVLQHSRIDSLQDSLEFHVRDEDALGDEFVGGYTLHLSDARKQAAGASEGIAELPLHPARGM